MDDSILGEAEQLNRSKLLDFEVVNVLEFV